LNSVIIRTCERTGLVLGVLAVLGCALTGQGFGMNLGVTLGVAIALSNLVLIRKAVTAVVSNGQVHGKQAGIWALVFVLKLGVLLAVVYTAVEFGGADVTGLLLGVSAVFAAVIVVSLLLAAKGPEELDALEVEVPQPSQSNTGRG